MDAKHSISTGIGFSGAAFFVIALCAAASPAQAHTFCASNSADLQSALTLASDGNTYQNENNFIYLTAHTYFTGAATNDGPFLYSNSKSASQLIIAGGYKSFSSNCTASVPSFDPTLSVLDGGGSTPVLELHSTTAAIDVSYLTIQNGNSTSIGAGLSINSTTGGNGAWNIHNNVIRKNHTSNAAGGVFAYSSGAGISFFTNNLVVGNSSTQAFGAGSLISNGPAGASVYNNTVTRNTTTTANASGGLRFYCAGTDGINCDVVDNIFVANTFSGFELGSNNLTLNYNDYNNTTGFAPLHHAGNTSADPKFVNASANGNFHLAFNSPLIGATPLSPSVYARDLDGHLYSQRGPSDFGAYEATILKDGFDDAGI